MPPAVDAVAYFLLTGFYLLTLAFTDKSSYYPHGLLSMLFKLHT